MLEIVLFLLTSPPTDLPISLSTNQVRSVATSNINGFTSNHLLQQMYGTTVLDEDVDVGFNDEELELIAGNAVVAKSYGSDVIFNGNTIISLKTVLKYQNDHNSLIRLIKKRFGRHITDLAARELSQQLRHEAPRVGKRQHRGFLFNLRSGKLCFLDTPGCTPNWVRQ